MSSVNPTRDAGQRRRPTRPRRAHAGADRAGTPVLLIVDPTGGRRTVAVRPGWTRIGRDAGAGIRLDHPTVSPRHASLVRDPDGRLQIIDDRSLTGIELNGSAVAWARVQPGDELRIGAFRIGVLADSAAATAA